MLRPRPWDASTADSGRRPDLAGARTVPPQDAIQPTVGTLLRRTLDFDDSPPAALKLLLDFLDAQANTHGVGNPRLVQQWKHNAVLACLLLPILERPQRLLNIRVTLAEQNRYADAPFNLDAGVRSCLTDDVSSVAAIWRTAFWPWRRR